MIAGQCFSFSFPFFINQTKATRRLNDYFLLHRWIGFSITDPKTQIPKKFSLCLLWCLAPDDDIVHGRGFSIAFWSKSRAELLLNGACDCRECEYLR